MQILAELPTHFMTGVWGVLAIDENYRLFYTTPHPLPLFPIPDNADADPEEEGGKGSCPETGG